MLSLVGIKLSVSGPGSDTRLEWVGRHSERLRLGLLRRLVVSMLGPWTSDFERVR